MCEVELNLITPIHDGVLGFGVEPHNESSDEFNTQETKIKG
jgi:hypothetical protein